MDVYCTDWQSINSPNWTFQNNNFISRPLKAAILLSHNAIAKPEVFLSMDLIRSYHYVTFWKVGGLALITGMRVFRIFPDFRIF